MKFDNHILMLTLTLVNQAIQAILNIKKRRLITNILINILANPFKDALHLICL